MTNARTLVAILDAAYRLAPTDEQWLAEVVEASRPVLDMGLGVAGYYTAVGGPSEIRTWGYVGELDTRVRSFDDVLSTLGREAMRQLHLRGPFGSTTHLDYEPCPPDTKGASSAVGVMGLDSEGYGVSLASWSAPGRVFEATPAVEAFWARVAAHLATAARLRRRLQALAAEPDAVMEPGGRVLHAAGSARSAVVRAALRDAAVRVDRARGGPMKSDAGDALSLWRCVVERRWTILDRFESDGRRYVVAYPNAPDPRVRLEMLTPRERAAAMGAAMGHSNKVIAYELGVSESTVSTLLTRAARKIGAGNRVELVRTLRGVPHEP